MLGGSAEDLTEQLAAYVQSQCRSVLDTAVAENVELLLRDGDTEGAVEMYFHEMFESGDAEFVDYFESTVSFLNCGN